MGKIELKVEVDAELLAEAQQKGVVLGPALEAGIRAALSKAESRGLGGVAPVGEQGDRSAAARQWAEENAEAIESHRQRIEEYGVFGEDLRTW
jgi:post-segregation antitoxin (ccd killing protein)